MERYRSGHNEAVLKTVCPQGHVGSNPTLSGKREELCTGKALFGIEKESGIREKGRGKK